MRKIITLFLLFGTYIGAAQSQRGLVLTSEAKQQPTGKTYALILGISKYKNPAIPKLQFADRDAIAFRDYVLATGVDSNNIILRTNENARYADIMLDLDDICNNKAKAGDKVFIYFSGHGDVESHVVTNDGYLLPYDAPKNVYCISAINVKILQTYVSTLSSKGIQVIVITDACHSGNLAGGLEGLKNIQTVLGNKWQDEIKILSCQPGELSLEGKQWGGGRGLFSYELINGLAGMADRNKDGRVTLNELNRYLVEKVADDASPVPQNPMLSGDMTAEVSKVNQPLLASLASTHTNELAAIDLKGFDEALLKGLDDSIKEDYRLFKGYLDKGKLISDSSEVSAHSLWQQISLNDTAKYLAAIMKKNLTSAMYNDAQNLINFYFSNVFNSNQKSWRHIGPMIVKTDRELQYVLDYINSNSSLYTEVKSKELFLRSMRGQDNNLKLILIDSSIALSPNSAFAYYHKSAIYRRMHNDSMQVYYLFRAMDLAPAWTSPILDLACVYLSQNKNDSAIKYCNISIDIDSNEDRAYAVKGLTYLNAHDTLEAIRQMKLAIKADPLDARNHSGLSIIYKNIGRYKDAETYLRTSIEIDSDYADGYLLLSALLVLEKDYSGAKAHFIQALKLGIGDIDLIVNDEDTAPIKTLPEFKAIMRKYFPDQYKE